MGLPLINISNQQGWDGFSRYFAATIHKALMADTKTSLPRNLLNIAHTHNLPMSGLVAVIELLNEGSLKYASFSWSSENR